MITAYFSWKKCKLIRFRIFLQMWILFVCTMYEIGRRFSNRMGYIVWWQEKQWPDGEGAGLRIERSGLEPQPGQYIVYLIKTLYHGASIHPGV